MKISIFFLYLILPILSLSQTNDEITIYKIFFSNSLGRSIDTNRITLDSFQGFEWKDFKQIIVIDSTSTYFPFKIQYKHLREDLPEIERATYKNFKKSNKISERFVKPAQLDNIEMVTRSEIQQIFIQNEKGWESFYNKYPNSQGILHVSAIGFNNDKDQGLLYVGNQAHNVAGLGYFVFFKKTKIGWKEEKISIVWMS